MNPLTAIMFCVLSWVYTAILLFDMIAEKNNWQWGVLFRFESFWVGIHYSPYNKRVCINLIPCITLWITFPKGKIPEKLFAICNRL